MSTPVGTYRLGAQVILRVAGFPVEAIQALRAGAWAAAVDRWLERRDALDRAAAPAIGALRTDGKLRRRVERREALDETAATPALDAYRDAHRHAGEAEAEHRARHDEAIEAGRTRLYRFAASDRFRRVLAWSSPGLEDRLAADPASLPRRTSDWRRREHTWLAYLQRLTTKNETTSFFGPSVWGRIDPLHPTIDLALAAQELDGRAVSIEQWVTDALAARIAADPEAAPQLPLAAREDLVLDGAEAVLLESDERVAITAAEQALLRACLAGAAPGERDAAPLLDKRLLVRELVVPQGAAGFPALRALVTAWPDGPARQRWAARLEAIERARLAVERSKALDDRRAALEALGEALRAGEIAEHKDARTLYAGRLPVSETCRRAAPPVVLGQPLVEQATQDLAPWYELWRDLAGLFATRIHRALADVWTAGGAVPMRLPTFLAACARAGVPLGKAGGTGLQLGIEDELQEAWQAQLGARAAAAEVALTEDDLQFVRRRFQPRRLERFDLPSPDLQLVATDAAAVARGDWQLLVGELHPDYVMWQSCFATWCPDLGGLAREFAGARHGEALVFGRHLAQLNAHLSIRVSEHVPGFTTTRGARLAGAEAVRSADLWVEVTDDDVRVRDAEGRLRGSLLQTWAVALNTHQLELVGTGERAPRLRVGRVIVQRQSWSLELDEAWRARIVDGGPDALAALRDVRRVHGLPEEVFVWPVLPLRHTLSKDAKPMFVDFRSPLLLELVVAMVRKYRRLRVVEMLPDTDQCWLGDDAGRYSFELRMTTVAP